ncbi:MAG: type II toxin-antitoxin system RelE/ParE family toxin [Planctomycetota bacterium]|mgnify:CR=1 FL=1
MFKVRLSEDARKAYEKADRPLARKLARCFEQLEHDPRNHSNVKRLSGPFAGLWRYRIGDYRVIYRIEDRELVVMVLVISHRGKAYR